MWLVPLICFILGGICSFFGLLLLIKYDAKQVDKVYFVCACIAYSFLMFLCIFLMVLYLCDIGGVL